MGKAAVPMANVGRGGVRRPTRSRRLSALVGTQALLVGGGRGGQGWALAGPTSQSASSSCFFCSPPPL